MMSALASVIDSQDPDEIDRIVTQGIPDPLGTFYRFSMASGRLRRALVASNGQPETKAAEKA